MSLFQYLVLSLALAATLPFVCRLGLLHFSEHQASVVLMHVAMAIAIVFSGYSAWMGVAQFGDLCTVAGPLLWIRLSYSSWKHGVPPHFVRTPRRLFYPRSNP